MGRLNDLVIYTLMGLVLLRPNSSIFSWVALSRRLQLEKDQACRAVSRLETLFGKLVEHRAGRMTLTPHGKVVYEQAQRLLNLRGGAVDGDESERVIAELGDGLEAWMLPVLLPRLLDAFGAGVTFQFCALDRSRVRGNVAEGRSAFGCAVESPEDAASESLGTAIGWRLLVPNDHRLAGVATGENPQLGDVDTVAVVNGMMPAKVSEFLQYVPKARIIECGSLDGATALVATGLAIALVPEFVELPAGCEAVSVDLPPVRFSLYLPRDPEALSDPASATLQAIRDLLAGPSQTTVAADAVIEERLISTDAEDMALTSEETP